MGDKTGIGWTEATWNPVVGCSIVSAGCTNCYAMAHAARMVRMNPDSHYAGTTIDTKAGAVWNGVLKRAPDNIRFRPVRWMKPRMIFVNSMSDLFHEAIPDDWIDEVFAVMALAFWHDFQVLTKRSARMRAYLSAPGRREAIQAAMRAVARAADLPEFTAIEWPLKNVWLGVSTEDQRAANERIPDLTRTPAAIRFASYEPAIGGIRFDAIEFADGDAGIRYDVLRGEAWVMNSDSPSGYDSGLPRLDWVIIGGESHRQRDKARPFDVGWAIDAVRQCKEARVAVFMKQLGSNPVMARAVPRDALFAYPITHRKGENMAEWPPEICVQAYPQREGAR